MEFWEAVNVCFAKFVNFEGRATRPEYWYFFLFSILMSLAAGVIDASIRSNVVGGLTSLVFLLPTLAVSTRRLHDIGRTGWWQLIGLTGIGVFLLLFWFCQRGDAGSDAYGPSEMRYG